MLKTIEQQENVIKERYPKRFKIRAQRTFPASEASIHEVRAFVDEQIEGSQQVKDNAVLFASEAATNAVRHGTPDTNTQEFIVGIGRERRRIRNGLKKGGEVIFVGDHLSAIGAMPKNEENGNGSFLMQQITAEMGYTTNIPRSIRRQVPTVQKLVWGVLRKNAKAA